ncbi:MAG: stage III sporulation protein AB, partial [Oscillospiraceae bacterium]|nr:stage III sporulation protein AB [Oscillospiraceae bacterium]
CADDESVQPGFLSDCRARLAAGASFPAAWREAALYAAPSLSKGDRAKLTAFGEGLGTTDLAGQSRACKLYTALFARAQDSARNDREKYGAYVPKLSLLLGLCAAVLLI